MYCCYWDNFKSCARNLRCLLTFFRAMNCTKIYMKKSTTSIRRYFIRDTHLLPRLQILKNWNIIQLTTIYECEPKILVKSVKRNQLYLTYIIIWNSSNINLFRNSFTVLISMLWYKYKKKERIIDWELAIFQIHCTLFVSPYTIRNVFNSNPFHFMYFRLLWSMVLKKMASNQFLLTTISTWPYKPA